MMDGGNEISLSQAMDLSEHTTFPTAGVLLPSREWSMVVIRDSSIDGHGGKDGGLNVFPPINHENLHLRGRPDSHPQSPLYQDPFSPTSSDLLSSLSRSSASSSSLSSSSSSFATSDLDEDVAENSRLLDSAVPVRNSGRGSGLFGFGLGVLRSKMVSVVGLFLRRGVGSGGVFWSFLSSLVVVLLWLYVPVRLRRRRQRERVNGLVRAVEEREEKIKHLLHQIAQMNEVLLKQHKTLASKLPG